MAGTIERLREFLGEREWAARALDTSAWGRVCARIARIEPPPGGRVVVVVLNARDGALGAALADALGARGGDGAELVLCDARYFVGAPKSWDLAWLEAWLAARPRGMPPVGPSARSRPVRAASGRRPDRRSSSRR